MLVTSEWSQRTAMTTFALEPRRMRVIVAKMLAGVSLTAFVIVFALVVGLVCNLVLRPVSRDRAADWTFGWTGFIGVRGEPDLRDARRLRPGLPAAEHSRPRSSPSSSTSGCCRACFAIGAALMGWFDSLVAPWIDFQSAQDRLYDGAV